MRSRQYLQSFPSQRENMRSNMGVGLHNSEYRRFNRSFVRGNPKPSQSSQRQRSPQKTRKCDLFVEAGRLAVEYLVSNGLLSPNVLSSKSQNHRSSQDRDISCSRKSPNGQDLSTSRDSYSRERRRPGRAYNSEFSHENEEGSLSEKATTSEDMEAYGKFPKETSKDSRDVLESKMACVLEKKDVGELIKSKDDTINLKKEETSRDENVAEHLEENNDTSKGCMDLLKLGPTSEKKSPRNDPCIPGDGNNDNDTGHDSLNESTGALHTKNENKCVESLSFTDKSFTYERKSNILPDLGSFSEHISEKRPFEDGNVGDVAKRAKQWLSVAQSDEYSQLSDLSVTLPLKGNVESRIEQGEEKQLFSSSFKICDLNLMGASDVQENHVSGLLYPKKNEAIHIDLSMNNNFSLSSGYNDRGAPRKGIEIIDLEEASLPEIGSLDSSTRTMDGDLTNMGSFQINHSENCNVNPDDQDGFGFTISELLGNDAANCSTVQPDMNSLYNDVGMHHGEGMFSEDDQIYMSLGEIPISLLRGWEQPTQERNPFEL